MTQNQSNKDTLLTTAACVHGQAEDGFVYRGLNGLELPMHLVIPNAFGTKSGVEMGFCSTTTKRAVAVQYASQGRNPVIFRIRMGEVNHGAALTELSQFPGEAEILFPPLCNLELEGESRVQLFQGKPITVLQLMVSVNVKARTIDELIEARKQIQMQMLENFVGESKRHADEVAEQRHAVASDLARRLDQQLHIVSSQDLPKLHDALLEVSDPTTGERLVTLGLPLPGPLARAKKRLCLNHGASLEALCHVEKQLRNVGLSQRHKQGEAGAGQDSPALWEREREREREAARERRSVAERERDAASLPLVRKRIEWMNTICKRLASSEDAVRVAARVEAENALAACSEEFEDFTSKTDDFEMVCVASYLFVSVACAYVKATQDGASRTFA